jgi:hypothetical protein
MVATPKPLNAPGIHESASPTAHWLTPTHRDTCRRRCMFASIVEGTCPRMKWLFQAHAVDRDALGEQRLDQAVHGVALGALI